MTAAKPNRGRTPVGNDVASDSTLKRRCCLWCGMPLFEAKRGNCGSLLGFPAGQAIAESLASEQECRAALLAWYAAAKAADPALQRTEFADMRFSIIHRTLPDDPETFEARKRAAFPLPEDTALPGWRRTPGQVGGDDLLLERDDRVRPLRFPDGTEGD